jgi:CDP-diacylglycerol--glycerol-3-phosphate 3-phosphatidyltransferase
MRQEDALRRSLATMISSLFTFHALFGGVVALLFRIPLASFLIFLLAGSFFQWFIFTLLVLFRGSFFLEKNGQPLGRVNLPIFLSTVRLTAAPTILFLLLFIDLVPVLDVIVPVLAVIFLTDLFDGMLARRLDQRTRIGRYLDATSDYTNLILISLVYFIYHLIPTWFFFLVLVRLLTHGTGIIILYLKGGHAFLGVSLLGKASVFATMVLYGFELLELLKVPGLGDPQLLIALEYVAALIIGVSLIQKVFFLRTAFSTPFGKREG